MAQQNIPYNGYPAPGALAIRNQWLGDHFGSNNYQAGGYNLNASGYGMSRIEWAQVSQRSQSGTYFAIALYANNSGASEQAAIPANSVTVKWYYAANSVEVANNSNLAAEAIQLLIFGI